ncbi:hypothetical protein [Brevundimonas sp.]|uniref:hypothetical protein n=1 Tax=Brevundimonas sp. TaxID=1871086 RepID=UPI002D6AC0FB|nr:hypothetical protein [Brevundimonas sp.]HYC66676.1 hypothetical protein [Brevundimonas sp.]
MGDELRSNRREVRNPVLALPGLKAVLALPEADRLALCDLLTSMRDDARARAQQSWVKNKGPMAAYWKATGAYVEHIRRAVKRGSDPTPSTPNTGDA